MRIGIRSFTAPSLHQTDGDIVIRVAVSCSVLERIASVASTGLIHHHPWAGAHPAVRIFRQLCSHWNTLNSPSHILPIRLAELPFAQPSPPGSPELSGQSH